MNSSTSILAANQAAATISSLGFCVVGVVVVVVVGGGGGVGDDGGGDVGGIGDDVCGIDDGNVWGVGGVCICCCCCCCCCCCFCLKCLVKYCATFGSIEKYFDAVVIGVGIVVVDVGRDVVV